MGGGYYVFSKVSKNAPLIYGSGWEIALIQSKFIKDSMYEYTNQDCGYV
jgi:hypothetical protein